MEDIMKKAKEPKKITDFQEELIAAQRKTITVLEDNVRLLREQMELKEKMLKTNFEARDIQCIAPAHNGAAN